MKYGSPIEPRHSPLDVVNIVIPIAIACLIRHSQHTKSPNTTRTSVRYTKGKDSLDLHCRKHCSTASPTVDIDDTGNDNE